VISLSQPLAIPDTDVRIARLGFGAARLFAGAELKQSRALLETALKLGITHFDTAPSYSGGDSERVLGEVLAGHTGVTITSKVGISCVPHRVSAIRSAYRNYVRPLLAAAPGFKRLLLRIRGPMSAYAQAPQPVRVLTRDEILQNLEASLQRLRRDRIDLYLVHEPDQFVIDDSLASTFVDLQRAGVIGAWGLGYGHAAARAPAFGQVLQCAHLENPLGNRFRIVHGLLRHAQGGKSAAQRICEALQNRPSDVVLFSASRHRSIQEIVEGIQS
jgi:aryl-alcohol dehydrogenase-like predicted oxidoreductase